ncbi:alpha-glucosidase C-terminal domain-containing protein [Paenibacillus harenae]|nr:alpha-glucosidase C-terminal domain-containing protein [Paenibacillus harenae]
MADDNSVYYYYKQLIALRKSNEVMIYGQFETYLDQHEQIYAYTRTLGEESWLVLLNISEQPATCNIADCGAEKLGDIVIGNNADRTNKETIIEMLPYEAIVYRVLKRGL